MVNEKQVVIYCKDYRNIENYEVASSDESQTWHCHHRLETHTSDGERRLVDLSYAELNALGMYKNRPASELIFLTVEEHNNLHNKGYSFIECIETGEVKHMREWRSLGYNNVHTCAKNYPNRTCLGLHFRYLNKEVK